MRRVAYDANPMNADFDEDDALGVPERYQDWSALAIAPRVAARAGVAYDRSMQDWPVEVGDPDRLDEFIALYETAADDHERTLLMELIFVSMDLSEDAGAPHWARVAAWLEAAPTIHARVLIYWSLVCERPDATWVFRRIDDDNHFPTTPLARRVLTRVRETIGFIELKVPPPVA